MSKFRYDVVGNRTRFTSATNAITNYLYNDLNLVDTETAVVRAVTLPGSGQTVPAGSYWTSYIYDDLGRLITTNTMEGISNSFSYDAADNILTSTDDDNRTTNFTYHYLGGVKDTTDPLGRTSRNVYDNNGRLTQSHVVVDWSWTTREVDYEYSPNGNIKKMTDAGGGVTDYFWDALGRVWKVEHKLNATQTAVAEYGYSFSGVLTRQQDPEGNVTTHTINSWGLVEKTIEAATAAHPGLVDREFVSVYDANGQLALSIEPAGNTVTVARDDNGRVLEELGGDGLGRQFEYFADGRLYRAWAPGGWVRYTYDDRGLLLESYNATAQTVYGYDNNSRLTSREETVKGPAPSTNTHLYTWTDQNELFTHTDPVAGSTATFTWNHASQIRYIDQAGTVRQFDYWPDFGDLKRDRLNGSTNNSLLTDTQHTYDERGDVATDRVFIDGDGTPRLQEFDYDVGGRLIDWKIIDTEGNVDHDVQYGYDMAGNRITETENGATVTYVYDERNRLTSSTDGESFVWDARGDLITQTSSAVTTTFWFDDLGRKRRTRKTGEGNIWWGFDSHDRITSRWEAGTGQFFAYAGASQDPNGTYQTGNGTDRALYGRSPGGQLRSITDPAGNQRFAVLNRRGDLRALIDDSGDDLRKGTVYTPYGEIYTQTGTDPNPELGYQSDYTDPNTGDVWMQARWYSPNTATFRTRDTYAGDLNTPVSLNRYTYASNNPTRYWDPTGRNSCRNVSDICGGKVVDSQGNLTKPGTKPTSNSSDVTVGGSNEGGGNQTSHCIGKSDCQPMQNVGGQTTGPNGGHQGGTENTVGTAAQAAAERLDLDSNLERALLGASEAGFGASTTLLNQRHAYYQSIAEIWQRYRQPPPSVSRGRYFFRDFRYWSSWKYDDTFVRARQVAAANRNAGVVAGLSSGARTLGRLSVGIASVLLAYDAYEDGVAAAEASSGDSGAVIFAVTRSLSGSAIDLGIAAGAGYACGPMIVLAAGCAGFVGYHTDGTGEAMIDLVVDAVTTDYGDVAQQIVNDLGLNDPYHQRNLADRVADLFDATPWD